MLFCSMFHPDTTQFLHELSGWQAMKQQWAQNFSLKTGYGCVAPRSQRDTV